MLGKTFDKFITPRNLWQTLLKGKKRRTSNVTRGEKGFARGPKRRCGPIRRSEQIGLRGGEEKDAVLRDHAEVSTGGKGGPAASPCLREEGVFCLEKGTSTDSLLNNTTIIIKKGNQCVHQRRTICKTREKRGKSQTTFRDSLAGLPIPKKASDLRQREKDELLCKKGTP